MDAKSIASKHGLALARVSAEVISNARVLKLIKVHMREERVRELLYRVGLIKGSLLIETSIGGDQVASTIEEVIAEGWQHVVYAGSFEQGEFIIVGTIKKFKSLDDFAKHVVDEYIAQTDRVGTLTALYDLPRILEELDQ